MWWYRILVFFFLDLVGAFYVLKMKILFLFRIVYCVKLLKEPENISTYTESAD
jgi:hypothetical protein